MNNFHPAIVILCVLANPVAARSQSIADSELTRTTLSSSVDDGGRTMLTAAVTAERGGGVPGGIVRFVDETTLTVLGWVDVARPSLVVDHLPPGLHRFRADYMGTSDYLPVVVQPSQSAVMLQTIRNTSGVVLSSSDNSCAPGSVVTLTAAIAGHDPVPTGAVTFRDGEQVLAAGVGLDRSGTASFTTSGLETGIRRITAEYGGDAVYDPATSLRLRLVVGTAHLRSSQLQDNE